MFLVFSGQDATSKDLRRVLLAVSALVDILPQVPCAAGEEEGRCDSERAAGLLGLVIAGDGTTGSVTPDSAVIAVVHAVHRYERAKRLSFVSNCD